MSVREDVMPETDAAWLVVNGVGRVHDRTEVTPSENGGWRIYDPKSRLSLKVLEGHPLWDAAADTWKRRNDGTAQ